MTGAFLSRPGSIELKQVEKNLQSALERAAQGHENKIIIHI